MWKLILSKAGWIFKIGVYTHRFFDGCNDLRYELCAVIEGDITFGDFWKQIKPTMKYHLSGEFQKRVAEMYKEEHIGLEEKNTLNLDNPVE